MCRPDPKLETAISDLEVNQKQTNGKMWFIEYEVLEKNRNFPKYKQLRVLGVVKEGSIINNMDGSIIFVIEEDGSSMIVEYKGIIPDIFDDGVEAVVEGDFRGSTFKAEKLFAKCPTKYEDADYEKEKS